jgi:Flp pilus assembly protein TadB
MELISPRYFKPMLQGWHVALLAATGVWMLIGIAILRRMVKVEF